MTRKSNHRPKPRPEVLGTISQDIRATASPRVPARVRELHEQTHQSRLIDTSNLPGSDETSDFAAHPGTLQERQYGLRPRLNPKLRGAPIADLFRGREYSLKPKPKLRNVPIRKPARYTSQVEGNHFHGQEQQPIPVPRPNQHVKLPRIESGFEPQPDRFQVGEHRPRAMPQLLDTTSPDIRSTIESFRAPFQQCTTTLRRTLKRFPK